MYKKVLFFQKENRTFSFWCIFLTKCPLFAKVLFTSEHKYGRITKTSIHDKGGKASMDLTQEKVENFVCENCGGTLKWNIAKKQLECGSCHTPYTLQQESVIQEHPFEEYHQREQRTEAFPDETVVKCNSCGAEVVFDRDDTAIGRRKYYLYPRIWDF